MRKLADEIGIQLSNLANTRQDIFVLDGDLADSDGAYHFAENHPERFLMAGISEQNMISVAAGMATIDRKPFVFSFAAFLCFRAYDQIRVSLSQSNQPVTLVGSHAGGLAGRNGKTHTAINDMALMLSLPNMDVWAPTDFTDVAYLLPQVLASGKPAYIRTPRCLLSNEQSLAGKANNVRWIKPIRKVTIVSCGIATQWAQEVSDELEYSGIEVGLLHCLKVNDTQAIKKQLEGVEHIFVIEDHCEFGGLASLIRMMDLPAKIDQAGWSNSFFGQSGDDLELRQAGGLSTATLVERVKQIPFITINEQLLSFA